MWNVKTFLTLFGCLENSVGRHPETVLKTTDCRSKTFLMDYSSGEEGSLELHRAPGRGTCAAKQWSSLSPSTEHTKECAILEGSKCKRLLILGATNWDLIGQKEVPSHDWCSLVGHHPAK